ncbi:MAG: hypothetical protein GXY48_06375 [Methanomicrobiales archaeon]|nr:hypothetical protein [Methanomicrobiales archaeon]
MSEVKRPEVGAVAPLRPLPTPKEKISVRPCRFFNFACLPGGRYQLWCGRPSHLPCHRHECRAREES